TMAYLHCLSNCRLKLNVLWILEFSLPKLTNVFDRVIVISVGATWHVSHHKPCVCIVSPARLVVEVEKLMRVVLLPLQTDMNSRPLPQANRFEKPMQFKGRAL